jgi:hypothetical protein
MNETVVESPFDGYEFMGCLFGLCRALTSFGIASSSAGSVQDSA